MAKFHITGPDGNTYEITAPDNAKQEDVLAYAQQQFSGGRQSKAAPAAKPAADDPGVVQSMRIGAGHTIDQVLDGLTQWWLQSRGEDSALGGLKQNNASKNDAYRQLQEQHPLATAVGEAAPAAVIPAGGGATMASTLGRLALAGAAPGALEYGSVGERAARAAAGATGAVVGGVVVPKVAGAVASAVPAIGRTARAVVEPLTEAGRAHIAGRTLIRAAGDEAPAVAQRLAAAAELVPGSAPTAAQVAENGGIAALERSVASRQPAEFGQRAIDQSAARAAAVRDIAGDVGQRELFTGARQKAADDLYERAFSVPIVLDDLSPPMRGEITKLMQMPAVQAGLKEARVNAMNHGMKLDNIGSIAGLHQTKLALDDMINKLTGTGAAQANKAAAIQAARDRLVTFMEKMSPDYGEARATYAAMSKPINQMDVGQHLYDTLKPALTDSGALAKESAAAYAKALRDPDATTRAVTGRNLRFDQVVDPPQITSLQNVATDLARKSNAQDLGRGPGSNTFQNFAMDNIAGQSGAPRVMGAAMNFPGVSKVARFMYSGPEEQIQTRIAQALLDPQLAGRLMSTNAVAPPVALGQMLLGAPRAATQLLGGGAGMATANLFSQ